MGQSTSSMSRWPVATSSAPRDPWEAFDVMDDDMSGTISKAEFQRTVQSHLPPEDIENLWDAVDASRKGVVDASEWAALTALIERRRRASVDRRNSLLHVVAPGAIAREDAELTSPRIRKLAPEAVCRELERRLLDDGTERVRVAFDDRGGGEGWISAKTVTRREGKWRPRWSDWVHWINDENKEDQPAAANNDKNASSTAAAADSTAADRPPPLTTTTTAAPPPPPPPAPPAPSPPAPCTRWPPPGVSQSSSESSSSSGGFAAKANSLQRNKESMALLSGNVRFYSELDAERKVRLSASLRNIFGGPEEQDVALKLKELESKLATGQRALTLEERAQLREALLGSRGVAWRRSQEAHIAARLALAVAEGEPRDDDDADLAGRRARARARCARALHGAGVLATPDPKLLELKTLPPLASLSGSQILVLSRWASAHRALRHPKAMAWFERRARTNETTSSSSRTLDDSGGSFFVARADDDAVSASSSEEAAEEAAEEASSAAQRGLFVHHHHHRRRHPTSSSSPKKEEEQKEEEASLAPRPALLTCVSVAEREATTRQNSEKAKADTKRRIRRAVVERYARISRPHLKVPEVTTVRRVWAMSDLHVDFEANRQHVLSLVAHPQDALIVAGDVAPTLPLFEEVMAALVAKFKLVFFCPGNHCLWVRKGDHQTSLDKFFELLYACDKLGVVTYPANVGNDVIVCPLFSWYDTSFVDGDAVDKLKFFDANCLWPAFLDDDDDNDDDQEGLDDDQEGLDDATKARRRRRRGPVVDGVECAASSLVPGIAAFFRELNEPAIDALEERRPRGSVVLSFTHFVPRPDLYEGIGGVHFLGHIMGDKRIADAVKHLASSVHVFGHSHLNVDAFLDDDGVRYVQNALGHDENLNVVEGKANNGNANLPLPILIWDADYVKPIKGDDLT